MRQNEQSESTDTGRHYLKRRMRDHLVLGKDRFNGETITFECQLENMS